MKKLYYGLIVCCCNVLLITHDPHAYALEVEPSRVCDLDKAREYFHQSENESSETILEACRQSLVHPMISEKRSDVFFYSALIARARKDLDSSRDYFEEAIKSNASTRNRMEYAVTLEWSKQLESAVRQYDQVLQLDRLNQGALHGKARVLRWLGRLHESSVIYKALLKTSPDDLGALNGQAFIKMADKKYDESQRLFTKVLGVDPGNHEATLGIEQLKHLHKYVVNYFSSQKKRSLDDSSQLAARSQTLNLRVELNQRWSGFVNFQQQDNALQSFSITRDGLSTETESNSSLSLGFNYSGDEKSYMAVLDKKKLFDQENEYRITLQREQKMGSKGRLFYALRPSLRSGEINDVLAYAGYNRQSESFIDWQAQLYYVSAKRSENSKALALSMSHNFGKTVFAKMGGSYSIDVRGHVKTVFADVIYQIKPNVSLSAGYTHNLFDQSHDATFGIKYSY